MNWLVNWHLGLISLSVLFLFSCHDDNDSLGLGENQGNFQVAYAEVSIPTSIVKFSPINTTRPSRYLLGRYEDPLFGEVTATPYFSGRLPSAPSFDATATFESLVLTMEVESFYGTDDLSNDRIYIHQLEDTLAFSKNYFNHDEVPYKKDSLNYRKVETDKIGLPKKDTSTVSLRLKDDFGEQLFAEMKAGKFTDFDSFNNYFKGLVLVHGKDNNSIMKINPSSKVSGIRMYYTETKDGKEEKKEFKILINSVPSFHKITPNDSIPDDGGTPLAGFGYMTPFNTGDGLLYSQAGTAKFIRLDFSGFGKIKADSLPNIVLNSAELVIGEVQDYGDHLAPPEQITYFLANDSSKFLENAIGTAYRTIQVDAPSVSPFGTSKPLRQSFDKETKAYKSIITLYLQAVIDGTMDADKALIVPISNTTSINRFVVNKDNIKVKIFYTTPK